MYILCMGGKNPCLILDLWIHAANMKYTLTGWKAKVRCTKHFKWRFPGESLMRQLYARTGYLQAKISTSKKTIRARLIKKKKRRSPLWYMVISPTRKWQCIIIRLYSDAWWNMHPTYQSPILSSYFIYLSLLCEETTLGWGGVWVWETKTKQTHKSLMKHAEKN